MVFITPNLTLKKSGTHLKKIPSQEKYSQTYFSRRFSKKNSDTNNIKFKPLKATKNDQNQLAFKGLNFVGGVKKAFVATKKVLTESDIRTADDVLKETSRALDIQRISGIRHLESYISRAIDPFSGKKLLQETVYVVKPLEKSLPDAFSSIPKMLYRKAKGLVSGNKVRNKINTVKTNKDKLNQLLGYYLESQKHGKIFDKAFSAENIQKMKEILQKGDKKAFDSFLKDNSIKSKILLKEGVENAEDFSKSANKLLQNLDDKNFVEDIRKKYITGIINAIETDKVGSFMPNFSNNNIQFINKASTGVITGGLVANDFYNLKMLATDDEEKAKAKRNQMFKQQAAYTVLGAYIGYVINSTFKRMVNRSLPFAVGVGAVTSVSANIISRAVNGLPLLPINPKKLDKEPYVIKAVPLEKSDNRFFSSFRGSETFKAFKGSNNNLSFSGWNAPEIAKSARKGLKKINNEIIKAMPSKMSYEEFERGYNIVKKADSKYANEMLRIARKYMKHLDPGIPRKSEGLSISHIEKVAKANGGEVIIGRNYAYRFCKSAIEDLILFPVKLVGSIGRMTINLGLKAAGKEPISKPKPDRYNPEVAVRNLVKWAKEAEGKTRKTGVSLEETFGERLASFHGPNVMEYPNDKLSSAMKLTGFLSVPFLTMDAYNASAEETGNRSISLEKAKQRTIQDSARQGISYWAVRSWNSIFKDLNNHSLLGAALSTALNCTGYEVMTRVAVGQPLTPKTHEQMKKIEKERLSSDSWLARILGRDIEVDDEKVVVNSKKLREFPGMKPYNDFITTASRSGNLEYKKFKENLASLPHF